MPFTPRKISDNFDKLLLHEDEKALLRGCLETPWDDAPFLVYADWVEEHGEEERAEFIREQVRSREVVEYPHSPQGVREWVQALLFQGVTDLRMYRGLPTECTLRGSRNNQNQDTNTLDQIPWDWCTYLIIDTYSIWTSEGLEKTLMSDPRLGQISSIEIITHSKYLDSENRDRILNEINPDEMNVFDHFINSPYHGNVHHLTYAGYLRANQFARINNSQFSEKLESLSFESLYAFPRGAQIPFDTLSLPNLAQLKIQVADPARNYCERLFVASYLNQLKSLSLTSTETEWSRFFTEAPSFENLEHLRLCDVQLGNLGLDALGTTRSLSSLRSLDLSRCNGIRATGLQSFFQSKLFQQLESLQLKDMPISGSPFKQKTKTISAPNLRALEISKCKLNKVAIQDLLQSPVLESLSHLTLDQTLDKEMCKLIASTSQLSGLKSLVLSNSTNQEYRELIQNSPHLADCRVSVRHS